MDLYILRASVFLQDGFMLYNDSMKLFASDFDGTLFFDEQDPPYKQHDVQAIRHFQRAGHQFGICTGRPLIGIDPVCKDWVTFDFYILSSGAVILDKDQNVLHERTIAKDSMVSIGQLAARKTGNVWIHAQHKIYSLHYNPDIGIEQIEIDTLEQIPETSIHGISFQTDPMYAEDIRGTLLDQFPDVDVFINGKYIDVVAKGVSKGHAMLWYAQAMQSSQTYGIGDQINDLSLLESVKTSFSFPYAPKTVRQQADHIVGSVNEALEYITGACAGRGECL